MAKGNDPAAEKQSKRHALTVGELCDGYLADAEAGRLLIRGGRTKKPSTLTADRGMIQSHINPVLGRLAVSAVKRTDVERLMHAIASGETKRGPRRIGPRAVSRVRGGRGVASRTIGLLGAIFNFAMRKDLRPDNPVRGVIRPADGKRDRRLSDEEYKALGAALAQAEVERIWPAALACVRFLALTGWRSGEALGLRWSEFDLARRTATLADTKTGKSIRPLSCAACDILCAAPRSGDLVFAATRGTGRMSGFPKLWARIAAKGELPADVTPHVLRHSFASLAGDIGYSESTIAALVGHKGASITSRYIHAADAVLLAAADAVASETAQRMGDATPSAKVVPFRIGSVS